MRTFKLIAEVFLLLLVAARQTKSSRFTVD